MILWTTMPEELRESRTSFREKVPHRLEMPAQLFTKIWTDGLDMHPLPKCSQQNKTKQEKKEAATAPGGASWPQTV